MLNKIKSALKIGIIKYEKVELLTRIASRTENELSILCDLYGSDKGSVYGGGYYYSWNAHTYTPVYEYLFNPIRQDVKFVFECGIGTNNTTIYNLSEKRSPGASLRVWRDYFPNAVIVGGDIDRDILFEENRIFTQYIDQLSESAINNFFVSVMKKYNMQFNIMIDDGIHTFEGTTCLFKNSLQYLINSGYYIIEDISLEDIENYKNFFSKYDDILCKFMLMPIDTIYNNMIIVQKI